MMILGGPLAKVAINGFGRIGRAFFKLAIAKPELQVVAINDLGNIESFAYLLQYDSVYGRYDRPISIKGSDLPDGQAGGKKYLVVGEKEALFLQQKDPAQL